MGNMNVNLIDRRSVDYTTHSSCYHSFGYECLITEPTRCSHDGGNSLIDHALSNLLVPPEVGILTSDITDHYPIFLKINYIPFSSTVFYYKLVLDKEKFFKAITKVDRFTVKETNDKLSRAFGLHFYTNSIPTRKKCKKVLASLQDPWLDYSKQCEDERIFIKNKKTAL